MSEPEVPELTPLQEREWMQKVIGLTVTAADCSEENGWFIEFDHRIRVTATGEITWYRAKIQ